MASSPVNLDGMTPSRFLMLPPELRLIIYDFYLDSHYEEGIIWPEGWGRCDMLMVECPTLFLTNKQIYNECRHRWLLNILPQAYFIVEFSTLERFVPMVEHIPREHWAKIRGDISQDNQPPRYWWTDRFRHGLPRRFSSGLIKQMLDLVAQEWNFGEIKNLETFENLVDNPIGPRGTTGIYKRKLNKDEFCTIDLIWNVRYPFGGEPPIYITFSISGDLGKLACFEDLIRSGSR